jgi:hypothetical protein
MKTLIVVLLVVVILSVSCKKDSGTSTSKSKTELLTAKPWIYDEYYRNFNSGSPVLYYKRGSTNNLINLNLNKVTYRADGTYTETDENGTTFNGTWKFLSNETQVQVVNPVGTYTSTIETLDDQKYNWLDPTTSNGTQGKMIHP